MTFRRSHRSLQRNRRRCLLVEPLEWRRLLAAFVVNTSQDVVDAGDSLISLREAIALANETAGLDTVSFDPATFAAAKTIDLVLGELPIDDSINVSGPESLVTLRGAGDHRVMNVSALATDVTLSRLRITGGQTIGQGEGGGGIRFASSGFLRLNQVTLDDNHTRGDNSPGGAVFALGTVQLVESFVSGNSTSGQQSHGGGIGALNAVLVDSTVASNQTTGFDSDGGGIQTSDLRLTQSTVSDNQSLGLQSDGGGIRVDVGVIIASTIASNDSAGRGGGIALTSQPDASLQILNSIVADNSDDGTAPDIVHPVDHPGTLLVRHSLIGDNTGTDLAESQVQNADGNLVGSSSPGGGIIDPLLQPLRNHGGTIPTRTLDISSPAIDRGDVAQGAAFEFDQRGSGFPRLEGGRPDMGATERQAVTLNHFIVNSADDELDFSNDIVTLREAIHSANGSVGTDIITFDGSVFAANSSILLSLGQLEITDSVSIEGPGRDLLTIDARGLSRVIQFQGTRGDLSLSGLTITGGSTSAGDSGGGIHFQPTSGTLTLSQMAVRSNRSAEGGGGIYAAGDLFIDHSEVSNNQASGGGGGILATRLTVTSSDVIGNFTTSDGAEGGGIATENATIIDTILANNRTEGIAADGGAIAASVAEVTRSVVRDNQATFASGGGITSSQSLRLVSTTVTGNTSGAHGGGIHATTDGPLALSISNSSVSLNSALTVGARGGGIFAGGSMSLMDSTISGNRALGAGADGGGLAVTQGTVEVLRSTVAHNAATRAGGGLLVPFNHASPLIIRNSIFALNSDSGIAPNFRAIVDQNNLIVNFSLIDDNTGTTLLESQTPSLRGNLVGRPGPAGSGTIDAALAALSDVGGAQVHRLLPQSPAIDAGSDASPPANDQRGAPFTRVFGQAIDMGAFESQTPVVPMIVWDDPGGIPLGTALGNAQLDAIAQTPGTFVYDPQPGTILDVGQHQTLSVVFTPDDTDHFLQATASVMIDVRPRLDFGDAPDSYATLLADDGPRHGESTLHLGEAIDVEIEGQPHWRAGGDANDDDGVSLISSLVASADASTTSTLSVRASAAAKLDAWVDFNANGVFDHPAEHIGGGTSIDLSRGSNVVTVVVPAGAVPGSTMTRFRLSTSGGLLPTGEAADGEVEDHEITILNGAISPQIDVALPRGGATVSMQSGERSVTHLGQTLLRAVADAVGRFAITGTEFSDVLVIDATGGEPLPAGGMSFDGGDRVNTLRLVGPQLLLDTSAESNVLIRNVDVFDLVDNGEQSLIFDVASARSVDPTGGGVIITGGQNDRIMFADGGAWRMADPLRVAGFSFSQVVTLGTFIQVDFGSPWQNLAQPSDVNNDGAVTAVDALRIINELGPRLYSDPGTAQLIAPSDLIPWPNAYFDQNGDGRATALDALRVINQLSRITKPSASAEGESIRRSITSASPLSRLSAGLDNRSDVAGEDVESPRIRNGTGDSRWSAAGIPDPAVRQRQALPLETISGDSEPGSGGSEPSRASVDTLLSDRDAWASVIADLRFD